MPRAGREYHRRGYRAEVSCRPNVIGEGTAPIGEGTVSRCRAGRECHRPGYHTEGSCLVPRSSDGARTMALGGSLKRHRSGGGARWLALQQSRSGDGLSAERRCLCDDAQRRRRSGDNACALAPTRKHRCPSAIARVVAEHRRPEHCRPSAIARAPSTRKHRRPSAVARAPSPSIVTRSLSPERVARATLVLVLYLCAR